MSRQARSRPEMTDDSRLARVRERFLTAEPIEPGQVRDTILASWRRCREWHVAAGRIDLSYARDPDLDTPLTRNALPVLRNLRESVQGQAVSVILTDAHGVALSRLTADHDRERHLDSIQLAPGFSYAEEFADTNGIGTALESGQAAHVFGYEHHAEQLEDLACAAVPIRHPSSGRTSAHEPWHADSPDRRAVEQGRAEPGHPAHRPLERQVLRVLGAADFLSLKTAPAAAPATGQP